MSDVSAVLGDGEATAPEPDPDHEHPPPSLAHPFGPVVARFDDLADRFFARLRGRRVADRVFYAASTLGDWSLLWHAVGLGQAVLDRRRVPDLVRLSGTLAVESIVVNQGVKRLFLRPRPAFDASDGPLELRTPLTSSFPSGHASAGFCAAVLLTDRQPKLAPLWFGLAGVVAASRIHVRMHHASDVVIGAILGEGIGRLAVRLIPLGRDS